MNRTAAKQAHFSRLAMIPVNGVQLEGRLVIPHRPKGFMLFAHGRGSSRHSPRNNFVAEALHEAGFGTLLMDLLTRQEDLIYENRFDIDLLVWRLERATQWLMGATRGTSARHRLFWRQHRRGCCTERGGHFRFGNRCGGISRRSP